jgi:hypothetical protein
MKADAGTWIYIILGIVIFVINTIGKNKKKQNTTTQRPDADYDVPSETPKWPKNLEDVLSEVLDLPKQKEIIVPKEVKKEEKEVRKDIYAEKYGKPAYETEAQSLETIEDEIYSLETPMEAKPMTKYQPLSSTVEMKKPEEKKEELVFQHIDLREGIIYAEILNRKYF